MWLLLIKNTETGETKIWEAPERSRVVASFLYWHQKLLPKSPWTPAADDFILKSYGNLSALQIAMELSVREQRRITKNAVVGRYRDLMARKTLMERRHG